MANAKREIAVLIETDEEERTVDLVLMADGVARRLRERLQEIRPGVSVNVEVVGIAEDGRVVRD